MLSYQAAELSHAAGGGACMHAVRDAWPGSRDLGDVLEYLKIQIDVAAASRRILGGAEGIGFC
jgi:hypothetical protein